MLDNMLFIFQVKDESKRTTVVAKLFPDKNRTNDSIPYDHARVMLPTTTDDYINACHVRVSYDFIVKMYLHFCLSLFWLI